jgi:DNA-binding NarL/FixJ family response regulator
MLTVFDDDEKVFKAICAGASGYLLKSTPPAKIADSIREALAGGAPMTPKVAGAVLQMFSKMGQPSHDYGLTEREEKILKLMTEGLTVKAIADQLAVSYHTADTHIRNIYTKLHVHSRGSAVAKGFREKLF